MEYVIKKEGTFDLSVLQKQTTNDSVYKKNYKMLSIRQLNISMDSIKKIDDTLSKRMEQEQKMYFTYSNTPDSIWKKATTTSVKKITTLKNIIPDSVHSSIYENSVNNVNSLKNSFVNTGGDIDVRKKEIRYHKIEWHRKFSLSLACIILFFIGAPLGSIIRKGGLGMPLVVAIIFFLIFHLLNTFGEKFVKEGSLGPIVGMWLSVIVLIPVGIFFTYKALHDSQLFNKEFYYRLYKKIGLLFTPFSKKKQLSDI